VHRLLPNQAAHTAALLPEAVAAAVTEAVAAVAVTEAAAALPAVPEAVAVRQEAQEVHHVVVVEEDSIKDH